MTAAPTTSIRNTLSSAALPPRIMGPPAGNLIDNGNYVYYGGCMTTRKELPPLTPGRRTKPNVTVVALPDPLKVLHDELAEHERLVAATTDWDDKQWLNPRIDLLRTLIAKLS